MVDTGYQTGISNIVLRGTPPIQIEKSVETATNMYPGRLVKRGTTDHDVKVADAVAVPVGWLGYEQMNEAQRKDAIDTILTILDSAMILKGGGFAITAKLAIGFYAYESDALLSWSAGQVAAGVELDGKTYLKIPYTKKTSEFDTGVDIPQYVIIRNAMCIPSTIDVSGTIDVGILSSEASGDADGFLDGLALGSLGPKTPIATWTTGSNNTYLAATTAFTGGDLLNKKMIGYDTAASSEDGMILPIDWVGDGTATSVTYTTSNHTQTGFILLEVVSPGVKVVGYAGETKDATSAAANIACESVL